MFIDLIEPLKIEVQRLQESLYKNEKHFTNDLLFEYGTFEYSYYRFYKENLNQGRKVDEIDFYNSVINELDKIEKSAFNMIQKWNRENDSEVVDCYIFQSIHKVREEVKQRIQNYISIPKVSEKIKPKRLKNVTTYKWLFPHQAINTLYKSLKEKKLIDKKTKYSDFEFIFKEKSITEISQPIIWCSSNATEVLFFILQLIHDKIIASNNLRMDYQLLKECFVKPDNTKFIENFKSLKTNIDLRLTSDKRDVIEKIVQNLSK